MSCTIPRETLESFPRVVLGRYISSLVGRHVKWKFNEETNEKAGLTEDPALIVATKENEGEIE